MAASTATSTHALPRHPPMSATATLTNCYVPLPVVLSSPSSSDDAPFDPFARPIDDDDCDNHAIRISNTSTTSTKRSNDTATTTSATTTALKSSASTRGPRTLRRIHLSRSILSNATTNNNTTNNINAELPTGSSLIEWGHTKLLCSVRGPRPIHCASFGKDAGNNNSGSGGDNDANGSLGKGSLVCEVRYMPQIGIRMESLAKYSFGSGGGGGGGKSNADKGSGGGNNNSNNNNNSSISNSNSSAAGGARIPRDTLSTSTDNSSSLSTAFLDETYLSHRLHEALSPAVVLDGIGSKNVIEVYVEVLQSDGGVFGACVVGASLALVDHGGVGMRDLVSAGSAAVMKVEIDDGDDDDDDDDDDDGNNSSGKNSKNKSKSNKRNKSSNKSKNNNKKVTYHAIADPTEDEMLQASGVVTIAMMPNWREVTVWDQFGKMSLDASKEAMELARDGCVTMNKFMRNCLLLDDDGEKNGNGGGGVVGGSSR